MNDVKVFDTIIDVYYGTLIPLTLLWCIIFVKFLDVGQIHQCDYSTDELSLLQTKMTSWLNEEEVNEDLRITEILGCTKENNKKWDSIF